MLFVQKLLAGVAVVVFVMAFSVEQGEAQPVAKRVPTNKNDMQISFAPLVKNASASIVNLYTKKQIKVNNNSPVFNDPLFKHFFGDSFINPNKTSKIENSLGSGVIVQKNGYVMTCHHVVAGSDEIIVVLHDKREFPAKVVLMDEKTDLAVLKIESNGETFDYLKFANSDALEVGDIVLAIGNPFGEGQSVTNGIVSAASRNTVGVSDYKFFIQTDASINPGNSGGALIDMNGKIAGINSALFARSGSSNGIGFAIPANRASAVFKSTIGDGSLRVVRPWVGINVQQMSQNEAKSIGLKLPTGALVSNIHPGGPAARSGLRVGDVVLGVDQHEIMDDHALHFRLANYRIGSRVNFRVYRNGAIENIAISMIAPPENPSRDLKALSGKHPLSGFTVANLSPALADELGLNMFEQGVVVLRTGTGVSAVTGLQKRDNIIKINGVNIVSTSQLQELLKRPQDRCEITLQRGNRELNVILNDIL